VALSVINVLMPLQSAAGASLSLTVVNADVNSLDHLRPSLCLLLYVVNPTSIAKPHAFEQLKADLSSFGIDIAII
jgi:hypothetical protein